MRDPRLADDGKCRLGDGRYGLCSVAIVPEEEFEEEIHVVIREDSRLADDGKRFLGDGRFITMRKLMQRRSLRRR